MVVIMSGLVLSLNQKSAVILETLILASLSYAGMRLLIEILQTQGNLQDQVQK